MRNMSMLENIESLFAKAALYLFWQTALVQRWDRATKTGE